MSSDHIPMMYEETDLPADATLAEWRHAGAVQAREDRRREREERAARRAARRRSALDRLRPRLAPAPRLRIA